MKEINRFTSLNPCFRGSWFDGLEWTTEKIKVADVLILVFVEVGLMGLSKTC